MPTITTTTLFLALAAPPSLSMSLATPPSRADLLATLNAASPPHEIETASLRNSGRGPASAKALLRLFDAPDGTEPRVTLYRDSAAWCPYCQKVWLQLEEKRIPYRIEKVPMRCYGDKPEWFTRDISRNGLLPGMKIDGRVITESNDIMQALENVFPDHTPLVPTTGAEGAEAVRNFLRLEREIFSSWLQSLTGRFDMGGMALKAFAKDMDRVDSVL